MNDDSVIIVGNGGTKATTAAFTIFYNHGSQKYELEQALQPDEQMWIDVGKLIRENVADKNGKTLPPDLTTGSYEIRDLTNKGVGALFEGKIIYDTTYGHVTYGCGVCCAYKPPVLWWNPLGIPFQGSSDNGVNAYDTCSNSEVDVTYMFNGNWSTANSSIATVDAYGTHTGQGVGSTTTSTWGDIQQWEPHSFNCPIQRPSPGGGDNVTPKIKLGGSGGTDITNTTQSVVVGQQIVLYGSYTLPSGVSVSSQTWSVPGTITGGFAHSDTNGGPTPYSLSGQQTTFYWYATPSYGTATYQVTFTLNLSDGSSPSATASFKVAGTSTPNGIITPGQVAITSGGDELQYIGSGGLAGMNFHVSLSLPPSGYSAIFDWDQIRTDKWVRTSGSTSRTCTAPSTPPPTNTTGQDASFPYATGDTSDSPYILLYATDTETTRTFSATMYAMWNPNLPNSIPVPLGYVQWNFSGDATIVNAQTNQWTLKSSSAGSNNTFTASTAYPLWSATLTGGEVCQ